MFSFSVITPSLALNALKSLAVLLCRQYKNRNAATNDAPNADPTQIPILTLGSRDELSVLALAVRGALAEAFTGSEVLVAIDVRFIVPVPFATISLVVVAISVGGNSKGADGAGLVAAVAAKVLRFTAIVGRV